MTAPTLLLWIVLAIAGQLTVATVIAFSSGPRAASTDVRPHVREVQAAWQGLRAFQVVSRHYEDASRSQCSFVLQPVDGLALPTFLAGQFLTFAVPIPAFPVETHEDHVPVMTRCYSLSDRPRAEHYRITVKRALAPAIPAGAPAGIVSNYLIDHAMVGTILQVRAPAGQFVVDCNPHVPVVLIGGGIGVTPLLSMLTLCLDEQPTRDISLFYGVRNGADHAFKDTLQRLATEHPSLRLHILYASPQDSDVEGRDFTLKGFISAAAVLERVNVHQSQFYVCGPPLMMESLVPLLVEAGVAGDHIHFEAFGPATVVRGTTTRDFPSVTVEVQFRREARTVTWDGAENSLLSFAEANSIPLSSGCRSGSCGSCETRVISGSVGYAVPPEFDVTEGYCLPCVGVPLSALVLDA